MSETQVSELGKSLRLSTTKEKKEKKEKKKDRKKSEVPVCLEKGRSLQCVFLPYLIGREHGSDR